MLASLKEFWRKKALARALQKPAPLQYPTGPRSRLVGRDFYEVQLYRHYEPVFRVDAVNGETLEGIWWENQGEDRRIELPVEDMRAYDFVVRRFLDEYEYPEDSALVFLIRDVTGFYHFANRWDKIIQVFYNRRQFARRERMRLLQYVVDESLKRDTYYFSAYTLMSDLFGFRWGRHPNHEEALRYYEMLLESLAVSGDIRRDQNIYQIAPQAFQALDDFHRDERRARHNLIVQVALVVLTLALAAAAIVELLERFLA